MFDISFFQKSYQLKKEIVARKMTIKNSADLADSLSKYISLKPKVFNIETTNHCNMKCVMCPRTTQMNRKLENMKMSIFEKIIKEIAPHEEQDLLGWKSFVEKEISLFEKERGENPFYFYVCSKAVTLHGYGEPLLDPLIVERVRALSAKNIPTYFSCNPSNIKMDKIKDLLEAGLSYLKFSVDGIDDEHQKKIRGAAANFSESYKKIMKILELKKTYSYPTCIVLTMIQLSEEQDAEAQKFLQLWEGKDVYAYIKSQDNRWYFEKDEKIKNVSHYEKQYCEYPWTSLTIMADGTVVPCTQDFNLEMAMGNIKENTLEEIWNSPKYAEFREMHISGKFPKNFRCKDRCDQKLVFDYLR